MQTLASALYAAAQLDAREQQLAHARLFPMPDNSMTPDIKPGQIMAVTPADCFGNAGCYLFDRGGTFEVARCRAERDRNGKVRIRMSQDNAPPRTRARFASPKTFNEDVIGRVLAVWSRQ